MRPPFKVYPRKDHPNWWVNFRLRINGKRERFRIDTGVPRPKGRVNEEEAARKGGALWLAECERLGVAVRRPEGFEADTLTLLEQWVDGDLAARARKRNARYAAQIETDIARHVLKRFPLVSQISRDAWNRAQDEMALAVSLRTCQRVTVSLRLFLRFCLRRGAISALPVLETATGEEVAAKAKPRRGFTRKERDAFLRELRKQGDPRATRVYTALLYTALRKSGLERMIPRWIDWSTGYFTVPAGALKNKKPRSFYLHPKARKAIKGEMGSRGTIAPDEPIFGAFDFDDHNTQKRAGLFWRAAKAAEIDLHGITAHHVTRHTACSIAGNDGATLAELMALGGWDTPAMAMRYLHVDAKLSKGAVERL